MPAKEKPDMLDSVPFSFDQALEPAASPAPLSPRHELAAALPLVETPNGSSPPAMPDFTTGDIRTGLGMLRRRLLLRPLITPLLDIATGNANPLPLPGVECDSLFNILVGGGTVEMATDGAVGAGAATEGDAEGSDQESAPRDTAEESALRRRLRRIAAIDRHAAAMAGRARLHVAFGLLERPAGSPDTSQDGDGGGQAPLLLMPVRLQRTGMDSYGRARFGLQRAGTDPLPNPLLEDMLSREYSLALPSYREGETPGSWFERLEDSLLPKRPDWRLRAMAVLAFLAPSRYQLHRVMDLSQNSALIQQPLLRTIFEGPNRSAGTAGRSGNGDNAKDLNLDGRGLDSLPPLVLDADADQMGCLIDALEERRHLVIEAPAGTGRVQTLTNLVAGALDRNLSVLYVSGATPAAAALHERLDQVGLGGVCLDLVGRKGCRGSVLEQVKQRLALGAQMQRQAQHQAMLGAGGQDHGLAAEEQALLDKRQELEVRKRKLARYARLMSAGFGETGLSPHDIIWGLERYRLELEASLGRTGSSKAPPLPAPVPIGDPNRLSPEAMQQLREPLQQLYKAWQAYGDGQIDSNAHPWRGLTPDKSLLERPEAELRTAMTRLLERLEDSSRRMLKGITRLRKEVEIHYPPTEASVGALCKLRENLPTLPEEAAWELLPSIAEERQKATIERLRKHLVGYREGIGLMERCFGTAWAGLEPDKMTQAVQVKQVMLDAVGEDAAVTSLPSMAAEYRRGAHTLQAALEYYDAAIAQLGIDLEPSPATAQVVRTVLMITAATPFDALDLRSRGLLAKEAPRVLSDARQIAKRLLDRETKLAKTFSMLSVPTAEELTEAAWHLNRSGVSAAFSRGYRDAKRLFQSLVTPAAEAELTESSKQAQRLSELADWRFDVDSFAANGTYQKVLGKGFRGIHTEFNKLDRLIQWMRRLQASLMPGADMQVGDDSATEAALSMEIRSQLVKSLMTAEPVILRGLADLYRKGVERLAPLAKVPEPRRRAKEWLAQVDVINQAAKDLSALDVIADATIGEVYEALSRYPDLMAARDIIENDTEARSLLQTNYRGLDTDFSRIEAVRDWALAVKAVKGIPLRTAAWLLVPDAPNRYRQLLDILDDIKHGADMLLRSREDLAAMGKLDWDRWCDRGMRPASAGGGQEPISLEAIANRARQAKTAVDTLPGWVRYCVARRDLAAAGIGDLVQVMEKHRMSPEQLLAFFNYSLYAAMAGALMRTWPELDEYSRIDLGKLGADFRRLDREILELTRKSLAERLLRRPLPEILPMDGEGKGSGTAGGSQRQGGPLGRAGRSGLELTDTDLEASGLSTTLEDDLAGLSNEEASLLGADPALTPGLAVLMQEVQGLGTGPRRDLKTLMSEAGPILRGLMPVFLATPEGVATFIEPGNLDFDLVVIDDAGRLPPELALAALACGRQAVIAGDPSVGEGLLAEAGKLFRPVRSLRWDHRPTHESLTGFCSGALHEDSITLLPSPSAREGLSWHFLPQGSLAAGVNDTEVEAVIARALEHLGTGSRSGSLGIITLSPAQRDRIEARLEEAVEQFTDRGPQLANRLAALERAGQPVFVTTLDALAGEARDVLLVSLCMAPDREGGMPALGGGLAGVLTSARGRQAIAALVGGARHHLHLFASMEPETMGELPVAGGGETMRGHGVDCEGVRLLQGLIYAARDGIGSDQPASSPRHFESALAVLLERHGYKTVPRFGPPGTAGIDLAVARADRGEGFQIAIEGDAPPLHGARSTRDRDRLRPEALERLGWTSLHLRSLDWHLNRDAALNKLLATLARA